MLEKPNSKRDRKVKQTERRQVRMMTSLEVYRLDRHRCVNPDCVESKFFHTSGLDRHHCLKKRPHNRDLDDPKFSMTLCSGPDGCHDWAGRDKGFVLRVLKRRDELCLPNRWKELMAILEEKTGVTRDQDSPSGT